jgi:tetratricopeptide (TPR) repeat protein
LLLRDPDLANAIDLDNRWGDEIDGMTRGYIQISRNRARRRQQLTAVAAVVFAFVAAAAVYGQYRVRQERAQAERNFDAALQTASSYANANQSLNNGDSASALRQVQAAEATMTNLTRQNPTEGMLITLADSQTLAGDVFRARGNLSDALTEYRSSLAIREAVVAEHPDKVEILGIGHGRLGYLLADKGDAADAVNEFRTALSIREKLVAEGKGDLVTRRNVLIGHRDVANMLFRLGDPSGAIAEYRTALAVASDPANRDLANTLTVQWDVIGIHQLLGRADFAAHDNTDALAEFRSALDLKQRAMLNDLGIIQKQQELALSHSEIGDVLMAQANLNEAAASYSASFDTLRPIVARFRSPPLVESIGTLSYKLILAHDFSKALDVSDFAISIAPKLTWLYTNRAAALMFLGRVDEAREVYLQHRGEKTQNDKPWEAVVAENFTQFRSVGLTHPLMDEIQGRFAAGD